MSSVILPLVARDFYDTPATGGARLLRVLVLLLLWAALLLFASGCQIGNVIGGMAKSAERQKLVDIPAQYEDLADKRVAVLVDAPMDIHYEHSQAVRNITEYLSLLIAGNCREVRVVPTRVVLAYVNQNVNWTMMDYNQLANEIGVDRLVMVDLIEYRLFEQGNSYYWDGQVVADVNVFETEGVDSTDFAFSSRVRTRFPYNEAVSRSQAPQGQVESGLQKVFAQSAAWMFYDHQRKNADLIDEARRNR